MSRGAASQPTSPTPGPDPLRTSVRPARLWTTLLYGAVRDDPLLPPSTKMVAQHLAWRADSLRVDEMFVSCDLVGQLVGPRLGRSKPMSRGEAQRHLQRLQGDPRGFDGASRKVPHLVYLERVYEPGGGPGGKVRNVRGETVAKANRYRLGPAALALAYRLTVPTHRESVDNNVVVAARAWRLPTQLSPHPRRGGGYTTTPYGGCLEVSGSAGRLTRAGARTREPDQLLAGEPSADEVPPAGAAAARDAAALGAPQAEQLRLATSCSPDAGDGSAQGGDSTEEAARQAALAEIRARVATIETPAERLARERREARGDPGPPLDLAALEADRPAVDQLLAELRRKRESESARAKLRSIGLVPPP